jgi:hypothetical protein
MGNDIGAAIIEHGSKLLSEGLKLYMARPRSVARVEEQLPACSPPSPSSERIQVPEKTASSFTSTLSVPVGRTLPTSDETTHELKRRLARELYRAELDLAGGLKIAGKACDCLEYKHSVGLEAAAEELVSQDPGNSVYKDILGWTKENLPKVTVEAIDSGKYAGEYPLMAAQFKEFRKRVVGTEGKNLSREPVRTMPVSEAKKTAPSTLTLAEAQDIAARQAKEEVTRRWNSQEKK